MGSHGGILGGAAPPGDGEGVFASPVQEVRGEGTVPRLQGIYDLFSIITSCHIPYREFYIRIFYDL